MFNFSVLRAVIGRGLGAVISFSSILGLVGCSQLSKAPSAAPTASPLAQPPAAGRMNAETQLAKPYVILVSLDGFRHDYAERFQAPNLLKLAKEGVAADGLIPVYPSKTFPNHYSIATGLYAGHHGLISNEFYDPLRGASYSLGDRSAVQDGTWYGGSPLWVVAEQAGLLSASMFWVGSEAAIQNTRPNHFYIYDESISNETRVEQVLKWLAQPERERPHLITLYFSEVDSAGHRHGTNAEELKRSVLDIDARMGQLMAGVASLQLPLNIVVVSDHGMADLDADKVIFVDDLASTTGLKAASRGPQIFFHLERGQRPERAGEFVRAVNGKNPNVKAYLRKDIPKRYQIASNARAGDVLVEAKPPTSLFLRGDKFRATGGNHGWDPQDGRDMQGVFYAWGPNFAKAKRIKAFENIHVYPAILQILGLNPPAKIDGRLDVLKPVLIDAKIWRETIKYE